MTKRYLSAGLGLVLAATVSGCGGEETPENCIERFGNLVIGGQRLDAPAQSGGRFEPVFTYDITRMENALEQLVGTGDELKGVRMTISHGASGPALDTFYQAEVPAEGAIFAGDGFSLYRVRGTPGSRRETVAAGCRGAPSQARLTRIDWIPMPAGTAGPAA